MDKIGNALARLTATKYDLWQAQQRNADLDIKRHPSAPQVAKKDCDACWAKSLAVIL